MPWTLDPILSARDLLKKRTFDWVRLLAYAAVFLFSLFMYAWQFQFPFTDLHVHAIIASEFDFSDLHSITSRIAYPMWHLLVAMLHQMGLPILWASAAVCAMAKTLGMFLVCLLLTWITQDRVHKRIITLAGFFLMFVTPIWIPSVNLFVYQGAGSPTVWHNPTQLMVTLSMFLCVSYTVHCWYEFERLLPEKHAKTTLPWWMLVLHAVLLMFSLACKPTFMQAYLPACALFFLVQWIRHPKNSRFFVQMILSFLPAVLYFLLQFLYYTGVVVPFTSGMEFGLTPESVWISVRSLLLMNAFPLFFMVFFYDKKMRQDKMVVLTLLLMLFSLVESMCFRETGVRLGHGNFNWASMTSSLLFWVLMLGRFIVSFSSFLTSQTKKPLRWALYGVACGLLLWHAYASFYYVWHLLSTGNAF